MTPKANDRADAFLRMIRRSQRGGLKVYLGYAAGVGKTWQMLQEGHKLKEDGIDVVIGLVETHGRNDTAKLIDGLEVIPRRSQLYRGIAMEGWTWMQSCDAIPMSSSWTSWPIPMSRETGTPSGTRTSRTCLRPESMSSRR